jgi:hypothetical protein
MGGRMTINSLRIGKDHNVATNFTLPEETNRTRFDKVIARLLRVMSTTGLWPEKQAYDTVLRAGVYENGKP